MSGNDETESGEYEVGYGKPPQKNRFRKGQSGNRKGRPKKDEVLAELCKSLADTLGQTIEVKEGEKTLKLSRKDLMIRQLVKRALAGQKRALVKLIKLRERVETEEPEYKPFPMPLEYLQAVGPHYMESARKMRAEEAAYLAQRKKHGPSFRELIDAELTKKITVTVRRRSKRMTVLQAIAIQFVNLAAKGDDSIIDLLLKLVHAGEAQVKMPDFIVPAHEVVT